MFIGADVACADTLQFTLAGPVSASFDLPSVPSVMPGNVDSGFGFTITPADLMVNGAAANGFLAFYNASASGGFGIFASGFNTVVHLSGAQIYGGTESNPTFAPGTLSLTEFPNGTTPFTLTVTDISNVSTPEPSVTVLLAIGLMVIGLVLLHFKPNFSVRAS
jgi:hypothetical protein